MYVPLEHSRGVLLAQTVTSKTPARLERVLEDGEVVVSIDPTYPHALLTARVMLTTLRRMPGYVTLLRGDLGAVDVDGLAEAVASVDPDRPLRVNDRAPVGAVRLHVGPTCTDSAIRVAAEGSGAHLAGQRSAVIRSRHAPSPLGAVFAAALGAGEAFKVLAHVRSDRRVRHRHLRFCPISLSADLGRAGACGLQGELDLALIGLGAIGTGVALILSESDVDGRILAVDRQRFGLENRGTYSIGAALDVEDAPWKTDLATAALGRFDVVPFRDSVELLSEAIDTGAVRWPRTVIAGLDTPEARRATQRIWPDRLIDAATGDTFVGLHDHRHGLDPCMYCLFPIRRTGRSATSRLSDLTGIPTDRLAELLRSDAVLLPEHVAGMTSDQRTLIEPHIGKPVCGLANAVGLSDLESAGYRPAIPFVSLQAACLAIGRLAAARSGLGVQENFVQYDALIGPQVANLDQRSRVPACHCQLRASGIARARALRAQLSGF